MFLEFQNIQILTINNSSNSNEIEEYKQSLKKTIIELKNKDYENICFYCNDLQNDPLDFKEIINIFDFALKNGIRRIKLKTNGKNITEEVLNELLNKGVFFFEFNIYGHTDQIHDSYTNIQNSFINIINAISIIEKTDIYDLSVSAFIQLNIFIDANNFQYLESIVRLGLQYKINLIELHLKNDNTAFTDIIPLIKKSIDLCIENKYTKCWFNIIDIPACLLKNYEYFINDFYSQTIKHNHQKIFIDKCQKCIIKNKCSGITKEYIVNFGEKEFSPLTDLKFYN